jgi:hypothetical protein
VHEKLEKFMEDVKYGIYPLTAFNLSQPTPTKPRHRPLTHTVQPVFSLKFPLYGVLAGTVVGSIRAVFRILNSEIWIRI